MRINEIVNLAITRNMNDDINDTTKVVGIINESVMKFSDVTCFNESSMKDIIKNTTSMIIEKLNDALESNCSYKKEDGLYHAENFRNEVSVFFRAKYNEDQFDIPIVSFTLRMKYILQNNRRKYYLVDFLIHPPYPCLGTPYEEVEKIFDRVSYSRERVSALGFNESVSIDTIVYQAFRYVKERSEYEDLKESELTNRFIYLVMKHLNALSTPIHCYGLEGSVDGIFLANTNSNVISFNFVGTYGYNHFDGTLFTVTLLMKQKNIYGLRSYYLIGFELDEKVESRTPQRAVCLLAKSFDNYDIG